MVDRPGRPARRLRAGDRARRGSRRRPTATTTTGAAITDLVEQPAKVMRIGSMIRQLLEEVKVRAARRGQPATGSRRSTRPRSRSSRPASRPSWSRSWSGCRCRSPRSDADRGRAADRPGPAGRLARGPLPRHPDRDLRPADGRPRAARADAPRAAAGCAAAGGRAPAAPGGRTSRTAAAGRLRRHVPLTLGQPGRSAAAPPAPGTTTRPEQADDHQGGAGGGAAAAASAGASATVVKVASAGLRRRRRTAGSPGAEQRLDARDVRRRGRRCRCAAGW